MIIVADTSALFAGFDANKPEQSRIAAIMETETLAISPLVLTELDHLVHRDLGFPAAVQVIDALAGRMTQGQYRLAELKPSDIVAAQGIRAMYAALHLDLADVVGVVLADRYKTDRILTLGQRDYRAIKPLTDGLNAFRILPADL
ncbi:PIN domain-containing protein [Mycolicibacter sp. MYC123]|uniref:PIN domain-containing protein n=1 Tax=[Mycobacterium] zoologicum TaxID=2872311 RepID=A0ABU5YFH8_9MYCO|nr:PIN domain-containing protein [Mycolicibacter sp. MYC123]MEB3048807.1 PIN domain-containing protein [Mycolicibacter sp. MYC123]